RISHDDVLVIFVRIPLPPRSTLFPYTTLFRSVGRVFEAHHVLARARWASQSLEVQCAAQEPGGSRAVHQDGLSYCQSSTCRPPTDRKSTRLNSSHLGISYAVFCLKKKKHNTDF